MWYKVSGDVVTNKTSWWEVDSFVFVCVRDCVLTTTPNCSGSDKFEYSFLNLAKAFSCSCSGRCFTRFYKTERGRNGVGSSNEESREEKSTGLHLFIYKKIFDGDVVMPDTPSFINCTWNDIIFSFSYFSLSCTKCNNPM